MHPTKEQAWQFALMIQGGFPPADAIRYFTDLTDEGDVAGLLKLWLGSKLVGTAILQLQGKAFQDMTLEEKIKYSLDLHYSQMAYFLYSRNYSTLSSSDKQKADTCRIALEQKAAGTAGQADPLTRFWDDLRKGKVTLAQPAKPLTN